MIHLGVSWGDALMFNGFAMLDLTSVVPRYLPCD